jgi:hypothetical protein
MESTMPMRCQPLRRNPRIYAPRFPISRRLIHLGNAFLSQRSGKSEKMQCWGKNLEIFAAP